MNTNASEFVAELSKLRPSSMFLNLKGYRNESGELADYNIIFHISYENALKKSIEILTDIKLDDALEIQARDELLTSFHKSLDKDQNTSTWDVDPTYHYFYDDQDNLIKGVKMHQESGMLYLFGLVQNKRVIIPGVYFKSNRRPLTIAKDKLRALCPVGKFRQFRMNPYQVESIHVENITLLPPEL